MVVRPLLPPAWRTQSVYTIQKSFSHGGLVEKQLGLKADVFGEWGGFRNEYTSPKRACPVPRAPNFGGPRSSGGSHKSPREPSGVRMVPRPSPWIVIPGAPPAGVQPTPGFWSATSAMPKARVLAWRAGTAALGLPSGSHPDQIWFKTGRLKGPVGTLPAHVVPT